MATIKPLIDAIEHRRKLLNKVLPRVHWAGGIPLPFRPSRRLLRRLGGWRRKGYRGALAVALRTMCECMADRSTNAILAELDADALGRENVLTGLREDGLDFSVVEVTPTVIRYTADGKVASTTMGNLENALTQARREARHAD